MSSVRVPVFFGSILTLVVLIIQNRAPVYQLTVLGMRVQPLGLGFLVAIAVLIGLVLGALFQRMGPKRSARVSARPVSTEPEIQTFKSMPQREENDDSFDFDDDNEANTQASPESPVSTSNQKGWDTTASSSWTEEPKEESFWSRRSNPKPKAQKPSRQGSVTPLRPKDRRESSDPNSVMDAEYRIVTPYERQSDDGFDDDFFDDFFEEEKP